MSDGDNDYEVGYGRPPKHSRFQKGQSGNPNGRPKGAKGFNASLRRELDEKVTVREGNRQLTISKAEAAAKRLMAKALGGDMAALKMLALFDSNLYREMESAVVDAGQTGAPQPVDFDILRHFFSDGGGNEKMTDDQEPGDDDT